LKIYLDLESFDFSAFGIAIPLTYTSTAVTLRLVIVSTSLLTFSCTSHETVGI